MSTPPSILVVDDDADVRKAATFLLARHDMTLREAATPDEIWSVLAAGPIDAVLLDLNFRPGQTSGAEGLACLRALIAHDPDCVVVVVTGHSGVAVAVAAMRAGAADFVMKPWHNDRLVATLRDAAALGQRRRQARTAPGPAPPRPFVGECAAIVAARDTARRVAPTDAPVLLLGEPGTGKSLLAELIHRQSPRAGRDLRCIAPAALLTAGTAALEAAFAAIDTADTLVIDGIDGLPLAAQTQLAALLAAREGVRLIGTASCPRSELARRVGPDLLYRVNVVEIALPPLRDRGADRLLLATHFLRLHAARHGRPAPALSADAAAAIEQSDWPGNLRELRQMMERAVVLAEDNRPLGPADVATTPLAALLALETPADTADLNLARSEKAVVQAALRRHGFNVSRAAQELGLTRATLYRRMARHGL